MYPPRIMEPSSDCFIKNSIFRMILLTLTLYYRMPASYSLTPLRGVHPLDEKYFASQVIKCKDGSKSFTRDHLNDDFCDCLDGTDEPGTSACPSGKFHCRNVGSTPQFIFSSRVNDQICDCCDGSDEYDGAITCMDTCVMGGNLEHKFGNHIYAVGTEEPKHKVILEDFLVKAEGLKMIIILQLVILIAVVIYRIFRRRAVSKRSRHH